MLSINYWVNIERYGSQSVAIGAYCCRNFVLMCDWCLRQTVRNITQITSSYPPFRSFRVPRRFRFLICATFTGRHDLRRSERPLHASKNLIATLYTIRRIGYSISRFIKLCICMLHASHSSTAPSPTSLSTSKLLQASLSRTLLLLFWVALSEHAATHARVKGCSIKTRDGLSHPHIRKKEGMPSWTTVVERAEWPKEL